VTVGGIESALEQGSSGAPSVADEDRPLTHWEIAELSLAFCILWFAANWATNASLAYTTVASSTILASMSGFFTLVIGSCLKIETFSSAKLIAVSGSLLGVVLVSEYDHGSPSVDPAKPKAPLFGDFLALMSALFYGCYTVLLKIKIRNESRVNMSLFFGFVGLFNLVLLWPMFGVLHWTGVEPFELPHDSRVMWMIGVNAFVGTFV
jgi:solute carrier family 35 protein F5